MIDAHLVDDVHDLDLVDHDVEDGSVGRLRVEELGDGHGRELNVRLEVEHGRVARLRVTARDGAVLLCVLVAQWLGGPLRQHVLGSKLQLVPFL